MKPHIRKTRHGWEALQSRKNYGKGDISHVGYGKTKEQAVTNLYSNIAYFQLRKMMLAHTEGSASYLSLLHE